MSQYSKLKTFLLFFFIIRLLQNHKSYCIPLKKLITNRHQRYIKKCQNVSTITKEISLVPNEFKRSGIWYKKVPIWPQALRNLFILISLYRDYLLPARQTVIIGSPNCELCFIVIPRDNLTRHSYNHVQKHQGPNVQSCSDKTNRIIYKPQYRLQHS